MDFTKYVALLHSQALFFASAAGFDDPFEGSYPRANEAMRPKAYGEHFELVMSHLPGFIRWTRKWTFINCWHMNEFESAAMWKLYAKTDEAIAVQSTYQRLTTVLPDDSYIGQVTYLDYETEWVSEGNSFYPFVHKRKSFEHEREVRAVIQELPFEGENLDRAKDGPPGKLVPVDLGMLIERVFVAPTSPNWFLRLVQDVTVKYELTQQATRSALDQEPFY